MSVEQPAGGPWQAAASFGSDLVVDLLRELGYRYLPMNPGSSFRGLHDSVVNHGGNTAPQLLLCLHEEIAVSLAHGYAKATGLPAVAAVHDLVGLMHASMAVYNACLDRVPLLLLGGSGPADPRLRRPIDWIHSATTQAELVRPYVKWDDEPATPAAFPDSVLRAHQIALSAPTGPTYVSLDATAQEAPLPEALPLPDLALHRPAPPVAPDPQAVAAAAELLLHARCPVVAGGRVGRVPAATAPLVELVELLGASYTDDRNTVAFPTAHAQNCTGDADLLAGADVLLAVDVVDIPGLLAAGGATAGHPPAIVDLSHGDLGLRSWSNAFAAATPRAVQLLADPVRGLVALVEAVRAARDGGTPSGARARARAEAVRARQRQHLAEHWDDVPISAARLVAETWHAVRDHDWLLALRNTRSWPEGIWQFTAAGQYLGHSGGGGVGYGPGAMVGAALAARDQGRLAVGIIGDGDLLMAPGALWTAVHYRIPLLLVVNDNGSFHNDKPHQERVARRRQRREENAWIGTRIADPAVDIASLARSYGCQAHGPVHDPGELAGALATAAKQALAGDVAVVHVRTGA